MKELIENELTKYKNIVNSYDGIDDSQYSKIEKMIFEEAEKDSFAIAFHHFLKLNNKIGLENDWQNNQWCEHVYIFAAEHILETIKFIKEECSADEFSTIVVSLAEDITEKTKSKDFVCCIEETAKKFPEECEKYNILDNIKTCKIILE